MSDHEYHAAIAKLVAYGLFTVCATLFALSRPSAAGNLEDTPSAVLQITPAESLATFPGDAKYFTGTVTVDMLFQPNSTRNASAASVVFAPGARTAWHSHPAGQTLVVSSGTGWVQIDGHERMTIKKGDVVWIPANAKHWHGATDTTSMTHIAFQEQRDGRVVQWMEPVSDEQYPGTSAGE